MLDTVKKLSFCIIKVHIDLRMPKCFKHQRYNSQLPNPEKGAVQIQKYKTKGHHVFQLNQAYHKTSTRSLK